MPAREVTENTDFAEGLPQMIHLLQEKPLGAHIEPWIAKLGSVTSFWPSISPWMSRSARAFRVQHQGKPYRILFALNPRRNAYLIPGGAKTGDANWYVDAIRRADAI